MNTIASHILEKKIFKNGRVFVARTGAKDVVTIQGSILGGHYMLPNAQQAVPTFASKLFDAGTKTHAKDVLRESLASRGATINFGSTGDRTYFSGSCLPEDLSFLLKTISECIGTPLFATTEITTVRSELLGKLKESKTDTRIQAKQELSRLLYDQNHVNYADADAATKKKIESVTRKEIQSFQKMLGKDELIIAIAGDVDAKAFAAVEKAFTSLPSGAAGTAVKSRNKKIQTNVQKNISIPHKTSVDVYAGIALPITYDDAMYQPLRVLTHMLGGGGFTTHLMKTIRERDGLTYVTSARLMDFEKGVEGMFRAYASFAPEMYERGLATLQKELRVFFDTGITEEELAKKKDELVGEYAIGLSTTGGLAAQLHLIGERGYDLSYLDEYLEIIKSITVADLKKAAALIQLDKLSVAAAGTFVK